MLLPGACIVAADEAAGVGHDHPAAAVNVNDGAGPRRDLVASGSPERTSGGDVESRQKRSALEIALHDDAGLVDDRRARHAPLAFGVRQRSGVESAEIAAPQERAGKVEREQTFGAKEDD